MEPPHFRAGLTQALYFPRVHGLGQAQAAATNLSHKTPALGSAKRNSEEMLSFMVF